jgi:hypothetical protein
MRIGGRTRESARLFGPVGVTAGLATFFFGIAGQFNHWNGYSTNIWAGIILVVIGLILSFLYLCSLDSNGKS